MTEQEFDDIKSQHGYNLSGLIQSARNGFNKAYDESKAEGFPQNQVLSEPSSARANAVYEVLQAQYGNIDLKSLGIGALLQAAGVVEQLNDVIRGLEALSNTSKEEFDSFLSSLRDSVASRQASAAVIGNEFRI